MKLAIFTIGFAVLLFISPFAYLATAPTEEIFIRAIGIADGPGYKTIVDFIPAAYASFYLKHVRKLKDWSERPPLTWLLGGCDFQDISRGHCSEFAEWLLAQGANVNERDHSPTLGITALHEAVLACRLANINFLLVHGADPNVPTTGSRYLNMTPLRFLQELKTKGTWSEQCLDSDRIVATLIDKGGHE